MLLLGMFRFMFVATACVVLCLSCTSQKESLLTKKYTSAGLKEDAALCRDVVLAMHPAVGVYKPAEYFRTLFNDFIKGLNDSLTEKQFRLRLKLVLNELHCGHTEVMASTGFYRQTMRTKLNYSPYVFLPSGEKVFIWANLNKKQDSTLKKGVEVTHINHIPVDSMLRYSKRFVSADGFNQTAKKHYVEAGFNSYYLSLFGRPDTFEIEYRNGETNGMLRYGAVKLKRMPPLPLEPQNDSLFVKYKRARMKYRYLDNDKKTMLLRIDRFSHRKENKAYRKIFRELNKNKTQNLVIDLRGNGGGSLANSYRLLSYLIDSAHTQTLKTSIKKYPYGQYTKGNMWFSLTRVVFKVISKKRTVNDTDYFSYTIKPRKKSRFKGRLFVLTNGGSFSASCLVAAYLKRCSNAVFIGEETGGAAEGCNAGITPYYKLPNTKLRVRVPAFRIVHDVSPQLTGHGILPDYVIEYGPKEMLSKKDLELQKVQELINKAQ